MSRTTVVTGVVVDETATLTLAEMCRSCGISSETLIDLVEEGVVEPLGSDPSGWRFEGAALRRARMAIRLRDDLQVNLAGAALALDLLDELEELRRKVRRLEQPDGGH